MHLGLKTGPLCPIFYTKLKEHCSFTKVPGGTNNQFVKKDSTPWMSCTSEAQAEVAGRVKVTPACALA